MAFLWIADPFQPPVSSAEGYVAAYAGGAFTRDGTAEGSGRFDSVFAGGLPPGLGPFSISLTSNLQDHAPHDDAFLFGGKAGYFFERTWFGGNPGLEIEVYHYDTGFEEATYDIYRAVREGGSPAASRPLKIGSTTVPIDLEVTTVAFNAIYRWPLFESKKLPRGRVQIYGGSGIGIFVETMKTETILLGTPARLKDRDATAGLQLLGGLKIFVTEHIALFGEYKYIATGDVHFMDSAPSDIAALPGDETFHFEHALQGNQVYGGLAIHF